MYVPLFLIHLSTDGYLDHFHLLAIVNNAAVNTDIQTFNASFKNCCTVCVQENYISDLYLTGTRKSLISWNQKMVEKETIIKSSSIFIYR